MKKIFLSAIVIVVFVSASGCAGIDFDANKGIAYYEPLPHLSVTTSEDCTQISEVVILLGTKKLLKFNSGYGSANLSVKFDDGMVSEVGQTTNTMIPETITALTGAAALGLPKAAGAAGSGCIPDTKIYLIKDGNISTSPIFIADRPKKQ